MSGHPWGSGLPERGLRAAGGVLPPEGQTVQAPRKLLVAIPLFAGAPLAVLGQEPGAPEVQPGSAYVSGAVVDHDTGHPLPGARVTLRESDGPGSSFRLTGDRGLFNFRSVGARRYEIRITHLGYKEAHITVQPREGDEIRVDVGMVRDVVALEPLVVTATRQTLLSRVGFLDRRQGGLGQFMARDEIEARNPFEVSDLFRTLSGFRVVPSGRGAGNRILGRGSCPPALYLDGTRLVEGSSIDEVVRPESLEAIEVYHASQTPAQFRGSRCGAVVAWSRAPGAAEGGRPLTWRRLLFAVGFLTLAFTATSL